MLPTRCLEQQLSQHARPLAAMRCVPLPTLTMHAVDLQESQAASASKQEPARTPSLRKEGETRSPHAPGWAAPPTLAQPLPWTRPRRPQGTAGQGRTAAQPVHGCEGGGRGMCVCAIPAGHCNAECSYKWRHLVPAWRI